MSDYGHAASVAAAFERAQARQAQARVTRHAYTPNTRAVCTACGLGEYWHTAQGERERGVGR